MKYFAGIGGLLVILFWLFMIVGWVLCLIKFIQCDFSDATSWKAEIFYGIGVFTGAGGVLGWFNFGK